MLALSGGGYRGLFTALVLEDVEQRFGKAIRDTFGLLAGTSVGGLLACGLAVGIPAADLRKAIEEEGPRIFPHRGRLTLRGWIGAKFSTQPLQEAVYKILGPHAKTQLSKITHPLLLPAVNVNRATPHVFASGGLHQVSAPDVTLAEAALASAAAPTYFPAQKIGNDNYADGGLIANAPDLIALSHAQLLGQINRIHMLSIGTCGASPASTYTGMIDAGRLAWIRKHRLIELTLSAQEALAAQTVQMVLRHRFLRIDAVPNSDEERKVLGLDQATQQASSVLKRLAQEGSTRVFSQDRQRLSEFFR